MKKPLANPVDLGLRIQQARQLSGLSRAAFAKASGLSFYTLRSWERPPRGRFGLTKAGIAKLVVGLRACGVVCEQAWLVHGEGDGPRLLGDEIFDDGGDEVMIDCRSFLSNHGDAVVLCVPDDSALPNFSAGQFVGGYKRYGADIDSLLGAICIVGIDAQSGDSVRRLLSHNDDGYTVAALNPVAELADAVQVSQLRYAAEVVWHRWRARC